MMRKVPIKQFGRTFRLSFFLILVLICTCKHKGYSQALVSPGENLKLLSRINLNFKGLEQANQDKDNPDLGASDLLKYYKSRTFVKHPVDRKLKSEGLGKTATPGEIQTADNALNHIFVGQSAYSPYFCGKDINWGTRPVPDNEWVWQLNRMSFWNAMASAYWHTGDEKYAKEWCKQLIDWTLKNPNDKDHNYAWRSIEAGLRGHSWTSLFQYFVDSPNFTPDVLVAFLNSFYDHAEYLMTKYSTKSNWSLMEAEGLAFIAITFPEFKDSDKWLTEAVRRLNAEIDIQVYPDGHQRELAMGYHLGCIDWFIRTYDLAKINGKTGFFPSSYMDKVQKMCEVPLKLGHPDGTNAQFGDSWAGLPGQHKKKFQEWAERFNRKDFLYLASGGEQGTKPDSTAYALPYSGLYSMRSSWDKDAICLVLKCGPDGGGHCQPDNGTFELSAGGRTLMPDGGSYIYSGDPENRAWFRQTKVHQTLTLDGQNSGYAPKLLKWNPGKTDNILVVENKSYNNLIHRRSIFFVDKRYFIIVDEAYGSAAGNVDLHFQFATGVAVFNSDEFMATSDYKEGWKLLVQTQKQEGLGMAEEEGQVSFLYTKKEPRPAFRYRINKTSATSNVRFVTVVAPYQTEVPKVKIRRISDIGDLSSLRFEVEENGIKKQFGYTL
ncbi:MAG: alginate lyase family protein [Mariniphaga sp.]